MFSKINNNYYYYQCLFKIIIQKILFIITDIIIKYSILANPCRRMLILECSNYATATLHAETFKREDRKKEFS